jgi:thiol-disulfide isomerase/thioredoxin
MNRETRFPIRAWKARWLLLAAALLASRVSPALEIVPYQLEAFDRARAEGKVTALQFHSGWCPICVMQERGVQSLNGDKEFDAVIVFRADYYKEPALRKRFQVNSFSTLVIFRGAQERARTVGDHRTEKLRQLFGQAL